MYKEFLYLRFLSCYYHVILFSFFCLKLSVHSLFCCFLRFTTFYRTMRGDDIASKKIINNRKLCLQNFCLLLHSIFNEISRTNSFERVKKYAFYKLDSRYFHRYFFYHVYMSVRIRKFEKSEHLNLVRFVISHKVRSNETNAHCNPSKWFVVFIFMIIKKKKKLIRHWIRL